MTDIEIAADDNSVRWYIKLNGKLYGRGHFVQGRLETEEEALRIVNYLRWSAETCMKDIRGKS